jgi:hypothetical protein
LASLTEICIFSFSGPYIWSIFLDHENGPCQAGGNRQTKARPYGPGFLIPQEAEMVCGQCPLQKVSIVRRQPALLPDRLWLCFAQSPDNMPGGVLSIRKPPCRHSRRAKADPARAFPASWTPGFRVSRRVKCPPARTFCQRRKLRCAGEPFAALRVSNSLPKPAGDHDRRRDVLWFRRRKPTDQCVPFSPHKLYVDASGVWRSEPQRVASAEPMVMQGRLPWSNRAPHAAGGQRVRRRSLDNARSSNRRRRDRRCVRTRS